MNDLRALILDFDGVVLESANIKTRAFELLFADRPEHVAEIVALHLQLAGVSRYEKFRLIYRDILGEPLSEEECDRLGEEFSAIALKAILECPFVPGAREMLDRRSREQKLFVASGTPEDELRHIIDERGLTSSFVVAYGSPATKPEIVDRILADHELHPEQCVFVGDALTDLEGARHAGIPFVGRVAPGDENPFEGKDVPVVADMSELDVELERLRLDLARRPA